MQIDDLTLDNLKPLICKRRDLCKSTDQPQLEKLNEAIRALEAMPAYLGKQIYPHTPKQQIPPHGDFGKRTDKGGGNRK